MGEAAQVFLTEEGAEALKSYDLAQLNQRSHEGELTARCLRLLQHSRRMAIVRTA